MTRKVQDLNSIYQSFMYVFDSRNINFHEGHSNNLRFLYKIDNLLWWFWQICSIPAGMKLIYWKLWSLSEYRVRLMAPHRKKLSRSAFCFHLPAYLLFFWFISWLTLPFNIDPAPTFPTFITALHFPPHSRYPSTKFQATNYCGFWLVRTLSNCFDPWIHRDCGSLLK